MVERSTLKTLAKKIINSLQLNKGDRVYIRGNTSFTEIIEELALEILRKEANPHIQTRSDAYWEKIFFDDTISVSTLECAPSHEKAFMETLDVLIQFDYQEDLVMRSKAPKDKVMALNKAYYEKLDKFTQSNPEKMKKRVYIGWPTPQLAASYNVSYEKYREILLKGLSTSHTQMAYKAHLLVEQYFQDVERIHVYDDLGTDFYVEVKGRSIESDLPKDNPEGNVALYNFPMGEIGFPPLETKGEGTLFCPFSLDLYSRKLLKNLVISFKDGKLLLDKLSADNAIEELLFTLKEHKKLDKEKGYDPIRTYNVAEFSMGINPNITEVIGRLISDEKASGSVHLGFGDNHSWGGTSESYLHIDFVSAPKQNIIVHYVDGTQKQVMRKGKWLKPEN